MSVTGLTLQPYLCYNIHLVPSLESVPLPVPMWRLLSKASRNWSATHFIQRRTYASSSATITLEANQVVAIFQRPSQLAGIQNIQLDFSKSWPRREDLGEVGKSVLIKYEQQWKAEFPIILRTLDSATTIDKTTIAFNDICNLPIGDDEGNLSDEGAPCTPRFILRRLGVDCICSDLGLWTLKDFPSIEISDFDTRHALIKAREFAAGEGGGKSQWHDFVSKSSDPVLQAFDYTADFYSRDLVSSDRPDESRAWVDFGIMGRGYFFRETEDINGFSETFALDLARNVEYCSDNRDAWRPNKYDELRKAGSWRISSLLQEWDRKRAWSLELDRPLWHLSEETKAKLAATLHCEDDEEVVFEERGMRKQKKGTG